MALFYFIASLFYSAKKKTPIDQEDNNLVFYSSNYIKNPLLKRLSIVFDSLLILSTLFIAYYYYGKMEFYKVETPYMLFILSFIVFVEFYYLIEDVRLYQEIDRIDAINNEIKLSSLNKKIIFILIFISFSILNIGILSVHGINTHFTVYYNDLIILELLISISLIISLSNLFISKFYYSKFEIKQISQKPFDNKIMEVLGEGKQAFVYKAYVPSLDTVFALKKLKSLDSESILRFEREFKTLKSLDNNNLVKQYTYNEDEERRICYVATTRAKEVLYLSSSR